MKSKLVAAACAVAVYFPVSGQGLTGTLAKIVETRTITIGHRESGIPLSYIDDKQQPIGYAVDLCVKVAQAIKARLNQPDIDIRFAEVNGSTRIPLIANGTIDLECGTTTNNVERQKQVGFSTTVFVAAARFASKRADHLDDIRDLRGKTVTANAGSNNLELAHKLNSANRLGMRILPSKDFAEGFLMLETGRAQALILDDILLAGVIANSKNPSQFAISPQALSAEPYAIMLRRADPAFKSMVDESLMRLYSSGEARKLYEKWFQSPIPPRGITLNLPPSQALEQVWRTPTDSADPTAYITQ